MKNLLNPKWLLVVNTLPVAVLFFLLFGEYQVINSLLDEENISFWIAFGSVLAGLATVNLAYAAYLIVKRQRVSAYYMLFSLAAYTIYLYFYFYYGSYIFPFSIPGWMISGNTELYACTFLMPMLAYSLLALVVRFTPHPEEHKIWLNVLFAVMIPVGVWLFGWLIVPLLESVLFYPTECFTVFFVITTLMFFFFLVRSVYILIYKKTSLWVKYQLVWKIPIALVLPLLGLVLNSESIYSSQQPASGFFGNFSSYWFYLLVFVNGILMCLPDFKNSSYRLYLYIGRCITFACTFYFFLVFLPFLPLSLFAIIFVGLGFLMLSPVLLFVLHSNLLHNDFKFLQGSYSKNILLLCGCIAFLVIPVVLTVTFTNDRTMLNQALEYAYKTNYEKKYNLNRGAIIRSLQVVKSQKKRNRYFFLFSSQTPYISSYYNWLVLDNLTLSDQKIEALNYIFAGGSYRSDKEETPKSDDYVSISDDKVESYYDETQQVWKSWVHLKITSQNSGWGGAEYATVLNLPEGCWISDYYLYVGDRKEMGILSEKKSALWVYSQIRDEKKDPGILYYLSGNRVAFKVFPFAENETRETGIEFIHKDPVTLNIDRRKLILGNPDSRSSRASVAVDAPVYYISAAEKDGLKKVSRKSYFHFLVDVSEGEKETPKDWAAYIDRLTQQHPELAEHAQVSLVNTYVQTFPIDGDWRTKYQQMSPNGGFYLDRGIKQAFYQAWKENAYPVIIALTDNFSASLLDKSYADFSFIYPESDHFYSLNRNKGWSMHALNESPYNEYSTNRLTEIVFDYKPDVNLEPDFTSKEVLEYQQPNGRTCYLRDNGQPEIALNCDEFTITEADLRKKDWNTALLLRGKWLSQLLHPEKSDKEWLTLIHQSFESRILTPVTSYLVVENDAQKAALRRKQKEVLSSDSAFDASESDVSRMSEPEMVIPLAILALIVLYYKRKKSYKCHAK